MFLASDVTSRVRKLLNDDQSVSYRFLDGELFLWISDCLNVMVDMRPDLFVSTGQHTCTAGAEQQINTTDFPRFRMILDIPCINGGKSLYRALRAEFDAIDRSWKQAAQGEAINWIPHADFDRFYTYPPAPVGQKLDVDFAQAHAAITALGDQILLPQNYLPAMVAFVVNRSESKEDELINTGRAQAFLSDFSGMIGAAVAPQGA